MSESPYNKIPENVGVFENVDEETKKRLFEISTKDPLHENDYPSYALEKYPELLKAYCVASLGLVLALLTDRIEQFISKPTNAENDNEFLSFAAHIFSRMVSMTRPILDIDPRYNEIDQIIRTLGEFQFTRNNDKRPNFGLILARLKSLEVELDVKIEDRENFFENLGVGKENYLTQSIKNALNKLVEYNPETDQLLYEYDDITPTYSFVSKEDEASGITEDIKSLFKNEHSFEDFIKITKKVIAHFKNKPNLIEVRSSERFYFLLALFEGR